MIQDPIFWVLLALGVPLFWSLPRSLRYGALAALSFGYLCSIDPWSSIALLAWGGLFFGAAPLVVPDAPRRRLVILCLVLGALGFLGYFKYVPPLVAAFSSDPGAHRLLIPLGISYYTFKLIHYIAEVARGSIQSRSFSQFATYLFLFPIFTAGPIERFDHFLANQESRWNQALALEGVMRILHGLIKKFVLAHILFLKLFDGRTTPETLADHLDQTSTGHVWAYAITFYLYVYLDFSAYSDIVIGASRLFGIRVMENFRFPIVADHIREYWRRWHISLSAWCQSYIYMPLLGLYRKPLVSLYGTFLVMGLWHEGSLTRVAWGLYHATGVALYTWWNRYRKKRKWTVFDRPVVRPVMIVATQLFVTGSMAFLIFPSEHGLRGALRLLCKLVFIDLPA